MNFDEYIRNPMGRRNSVFSHREMYAEMYSNKLDKIMVRENGKVEYELYNDNDKVYIAHIKIPSEVIDNFYYDVVVRFSTNTDSVASSRVLSKYDVEFFSNDPSFMFTFAHAFLKNKMFVRDLVPRMSKQAVKKVAKETNPSSEVGYVKSIYFAYLIMKKHGLFNKVKYEVYGKKYNKKDILKIVEHSESKLNKRQQYESVQIKEKQKEKRAKKNKVNKSISRGTTNRVNSVTGINKTKKTKTVSKVKRSKKI